MNTYKYKIHYKKYDFQIGGQTVTIPAPVPVYMNQLTQQQVLLAQHKHNKLHQINNKLYKKINLIKI